MSFVTQNDVFAAIEPVLAGVFEEFADGKPVTPAGAFPRIPYREAMLKYGSDKPDLRNPVLISDVSSISTARASACSPASSKAAAWSAPFRRPGTADKSRKFFDDMNDWARSEGHAGLGYITQKGGEPRRPDRQEPRRRGTRKLVAELGLGPTTASSSPPGKADQAAKLAGAARPCRRAARADRQGPFDFCWIVDFPMFEYDEERSRSTSATIRSRCRRAAEALESQDPLDILAFQYDIVCNGVELSSGAIRNTARTSCTRRSQIAGYSREDVDTNFSGMINAFKFGRPPHGGSAPGIDRIVMLLADEPNMREVVLFR
jgi:aspartyl-tRNA synthetase